MSKTFDQLESAAPLTGEETFPVNQGATGRKTVKATARQFRDYLALTPSERLAASGIWYGTQGEYDALDTSTKVSLEDWLETGTGYFEFHILPDPLGSIIAEMMLSTSELTAGSAFGLLSASDISATSSMIEGILRSAYDLLGDGITSTAALTAGTLFTSLAVDPIASQGAMDPCILYIAGSLVAEGMDTTATMIGGDLYGTAVSEDVVSGTALVDSGVSLPMIVNLTATDVATSACMLHWNAVTGFTSFYVYWATTPEFSDESSLAVSVLPGNGYALAPLSPNTRYYIRVAVQQGAMAGPVSNTITVDTLAESAPLDMEDAISTASQTDSLLFENLAAAPQIAATSIVAGTLFGRLLAGDLSSTTSALQVTLNPAATLPGTVNGVASSGPTLRWNAVSGATSYNVYYSKGTDPAAATKIANATTVNSYTLAGLTGVFANDRCYVWVKAVNAVGESAAFSSMISLIYYPGYDISNFTYGQDGWGQSEGVFYTAGGMNGGYVALTPGEDEYGVFGTIDKVFPASGPGSIKGGGSITFYAYSTEATGDVNVVSDVYQGNPAWVGTSWIQVMVPSSYFVGATSITIEWGYVVSAKIYVSDIHIPVN